VNDDEVGGFHARLREQPFKSVGARLDRRCERIPVVREQLRAVD